MKIKAPRISNHLCPENTRKEKKYDTWYVRMTYIGYLLVYSIIRYDITWYYIHTSKI